MIGWMRNLLWEQGGVKMMILEKGTEVHKNKVLKQVPDQVD